MLDITNIESHNHRCCIYLIQSDLYKALKTALKMTQIESLNLIDDTNLCFMVILTLCNKI